MSDRRVKFQISTSPPKGSSRSHRSREPGHDSGLGSSSSEQASLGGRPDRRFTAEDREDQLYSVSALQEALGQANKKVEHYHKKYTDMDADLARAHKVARDTERLYREEYDKNQRLEQVNKDLEEELGTKEEEIKELKLSLEEVKDERDDLRQRYLHLLDPVKDSTMRGGSGEPSSRLHRSGSKHDKGSNRKHAEHRDEKASSARHHRRSSSISVNTGARSSSKKPYIERMPGDPPRSSHRYSGNYTTSPMDFPPNSRTDPLYLNVPRGSPPMSYPNANDMPSTGNYVPYPLHEHRGRRRG
ncbi:hypothetical protein F4819DRAFT_219810 [Hypoxylon fuscum]|nr:hypothetical protein F4819DRAFT_219810 [Hypoxylon fuscum]